jgi:hypothetical protein
MGSFLGGGGGSSGRAVPGPYAGITPTLADANRGYAPAAGAPNVAATTGVSPFAAALLRQGPRQMYPNQRQTKTNAF